MSTTQKSWRDIYKVHPAADLFPMLPEDELKKLGEDIKANGLKETVTLWREAEGKPVYLLDGRNRLAAMDLVGMGTAINTPLTVTLSDVDPVSFIISKNIRRRHLTKAEIADLIVMVVKADFAKSEMTSQSVARSFSPNNGKRGGSTKDAFKEKVVKAGKAQGVGKRNIEKAIAKDRGPVLASRKENKPTKKQKPNSSRYCEQHVGFLGNLRAEIKRRRKENNEAKTNWRPEASSKFKMIKLLDWIEGELDEVPDCHERATKWTLEAALKCLENALQYELSRFLRSANAPDEDYQAIGKWLLKRGTEMTTVRDLEEFTLGQCADTGATVLIEK